ncbi:MAG: hypothetical protein AAF624_16120 [Bacteroidota bacterium]
MLEFLSSGPLLPLTVLLAIVGVYWLFVILGALDLDFLDVDFDATDADVDLDFEANTDVGADADTGLSGWQQALSFLHLGIVPFMVVFSVFVLSWWTVAAIGFFVLGLGALVGLGGSALLAILATKVLTWPLAALFRKLKAAEAPVQIIGRVCKALTALDHERLGQAELTTDGAPLLLTVKTTQPGERVARGERALVVARSDDGQVYLVDPVAVQQATV